MPRMDRLLMRLVSLPLLGLLLALAAGCYPSHPQSTFDTRGPISESQAQLFYVIFWVGIVVFILVVSVLLIAVVRYRRRPNQADPEQVHGNSRLEVAWTAIPVIILAVIAVPTVTTLFHNATSPDPAGLTVEAIGHQWWFEFRYPGQNVVTANELHIPVGEVVNIRLNAQDVIHSFWVPKLAGKVDMIPNNPNTLWLRADEAGLYYGQCAEFCGVAHAKMRFRVIAQPREEFDAWLQQQAQPAVDPVDPLARQGQEIFMSREGGCFGCHTVAGTQRARGRVGPDLTHVAGRTTLAAGIMDNTQENLRRWLEDPATIKPGNIMAKQAAIYNDPSLRLTEQEISALVAYLWGLK